MSNIHEIADEYAQKLIKDRHTLTKQNKVVLTDTHKEIEAYWSNEKPITWQKKNIHPEIMFVITINELRSLLYSNKYEKIGVCISNISDPVLVSGRWSIISNSNSTDEVYFVLNRIIAEYWATELETNKFNCIAARLCYNDNKDPKYSIYFHLGEIKLDNGGGVGGDGLGTGFRVPS